MQPPCVRFSTGGAPKTRRFFPQSVLYVSGDFHTFGPFPEGVVLFQVAKWNRLWHLKASFAISSNTCWGRYRSGSNRNSKHRGDAKFVRLNDDCIDSLSEIVGLFYFFVNFCPPLLELPRFLCPTVWDHLPPFAGSYWVLKVCSYPEDSLLEGLDSNQSSWWQRLGFHLEDSCFLQGIMQLTLWVTCTCSFAVHSCVARMVGEVNLNSSTLSKKSQIWFKGPCNVDTLFSSERIQTDCNRF